MRFLVLVFLLMPPMCARIAVSAPAPAEHAAMDHDLLDVTLDRLHELYREHRYTVTQVIQWHLDRIARYNGIYRAVQTVNAKSALAEAAPRLETIVRLRHRNQDESEATTTGVRPRGGCRSKGHFGEWFVAGLSYRY